MVLWCYGVMVLGLGSGLGLGLGLGLVGPVGAPRLVGRAGEGEHAAEVRENRVGSERGVHETHPRRVVREEREGRRREVGQLKVVTAGRSHLDFVEAYGRWPREVVAGGGYGRRGCRRCGHGRAAGAPTSCSFSCRSQFLIVFMYRV